MSRADSVFAGSIPGLYDAYLGPMLFQPYAEDMAARVARLRPAGILETAAGSGILSHEIARQAPGARLTATDLNPAMLEVAAAKPAAAAITWQACDATALPFPDASFDVVVCQFGVMFFPDKLTGFREARRVLRPAGSFLFNVWDELAHNPMTATVLEGLAIHFPDNPPSFLRRTPHGHNNVGAIIDIVRAAGFRCCESEKLRFPSHAKSAEHAAIGLCQGTPTRGEIEANDPNDLAPATAAARRALAAKYGEGPIVDDMQAIVFTAMA